MFNFVLFLYGCASSFDAKESLIGDSDRPFDGSPPIGNIEGDGLGFNSEVGVDDTGTASNENPENGDLFLSGNHTTDYFGLFRSELNVIVNNRIAEISHTGLQLDCDSDIANEMYATSQGYTIKLYYTESLSGETLCPYNLYYTLDFTEFPDGEYTLRADINVARFMIE